MCDLAWKQRASWVICFQAVFKVRCIATILKALICFLLSHCNPEQRVLRSWRDPWGWYKLGRTGCRHHTRHLQGQMASLERETRQCMTAALSFPPASRAAWEGLAPLFWELVPSEFQISAEGRDSLFQWSLPRTQTPSLACHSLCDLEHTTWLCWALDWLFVKQLKNPFPVHFSRKFGV